MYIDIFTDGGNHQNGWKSKCKWIAVFVAKAVDVGSQNRSDESG